MGGIKRKKVRYLSQNYTALVLGPLLFVLLTAELVDIATEMGIESTCGYDTQLYIHCKPSDVTDAFLS